MLVMPSHVGFSVEWETGEFITLRGVTKPRRNSFQTTSKERAEQKTRELKKAGFKNVKMMECIF